MGICPPNVLHWPKPQSSINTTSTFGAPSGAVVIGILSGLESLYVRPMTPVKRGSGCGSTSSICPFAGRFAIVVPLLTCRIIGSNEGLLTESRQTSHPAEEIRSGKSTQPLRKARYRGIERRPANDAAPESRFGRTSPERAFYVRTACVLTVCDEPRARASVVFRLADRLELSRRRCVEIDGHRSLDPSLPLSDVRPAIATASLSYTHTFRLGQRTASWAVVVPYLGAHITAAVYGRSLATARYGFPTFERASV